MGTYVNMGNAGFQSARNGEYVDKSGLIAVVNKTLFSEARFSCVTRCRRFGKSMAAKMLYAYYDKWCDSRSLFEDLAIAENPTFERHLNKYPVIYLDLSDFVTRFRDETIVRRMDEGLRGDIRGVYPEIPPRDGDDLMEYLIRVVGETRQPFIFIIDEWDAICREFKAGTAVMDEYVNWLRRMFKGGLSSQVFAGVYMTGILPIKKYNTQSSLNNFIEYSMVDPVNMAPFFGFTKEEVKDLSAKYEMDFDELEKWYDGYQIGDEQSMFNPNSVMRAIASGRCRSFWASTGSFESVAKYINMNFGGLKDDIIRMLAGGSSAVDPTGFANDMSVVRNRDDVLTVLIHLGYLSYDWVNGECRIPNLEVAGEMVNAVKANEWDYVMKSLNASRQLLQSTLDCDEEAVAHSIDRAHDENTSILSYNDENSLSCVLGIAYYYARDKYTIHRELPSGKGFADLVMIPRKNVDSPALVIELKCRRDADSAIRQIKEKNYPEGVAEYKDNLLLVGINYDRETKTHTCRIERYRA